jgi:release factor glutamine methyltransferase
MVMLIKDILAEFTEALSAADFESPELEASIIVSDFLDIPTMELPLQRDRRLTASEESGLRALLARRLDHEPLQYIFGTAYFRSLKLKVGPGCLIPRQETELLVELLIERVPKGGRVCELGAGSGAIGLALASERPDLHVAASEISLDAFKWAELNRCALALPNYELRQGDLFAPFEGRRFDAIVANLPYILTEEIGSLPPDVRQREPLLALEGGADGLAVIRRAIADAPSHLKPGGIIALEIGEGQGEAMLALLAPPFKDAQIRKDLCGKDRFAVATLSS